MHSKYFLGATLVLAGGLCLSTSGIIVRQIETADGWQIMFYRGIAFVVTVLVFLSLRYHGRLLRPFQAIGWNGVIVALALSLGSICYLFALLLTSVASALFIISAAPFFTAVLAWIVIGERVRPVTWLAMSISLCGIVLMFWDGFANGRVLGSVVALGVVVAFGIMLVLIRRSKGVDMVPAICLGGLTAAAIAAVMLDSFVVSYHDFAFASLMGSAQFGGGFILITLGARYVPAAEVALLTLVEPVLGPVWVWIGVDEVPSPFTLAGGAIVLAAVIMQAIAGLRQERVVG